MIYETNDLLSVQHGILVHGCNAQGKMGSGVAKAIRAAYPKAYDDYMHAHLNGGLRVGQVVFSVVRGTKDAPSLIVANAITQEFYGRDPNRLYVNYPAVSKAFTSIAAMAQQHGLSVNYPLIGCGLANGDWEKDVAPRIEQALVGIAHTLYTPRPYAEEMALIADERARARGTSTGFRSIERDGIVEKKPSTIAPHRAATPPLRRPTDVPPVTSTAVTEDNPKPARRSVFPFRRP